MRKFKKGYGKQVRNTEDFIQKSRWQHGDLYDYSNVVYSTAHAKVLITCREHGDFEQRASDHAGKGAGCPSCKNALTGDRCRTPFEELISQSRAIHGDAYEYPEEPSSVSDVVTMVCKKHGEFKKRFSQHIDRKSGCGECSKEARAAKPKKGYVPTTTFRLGGKIYEKPKGITDNQLFALKGGIVHEGKYDYTLSVYQGYKKPVTVICPAHGEYTTTPNKHLMGVGCRECSLERLRNYYVSDSEEFIAKAERVYGDKYDYSKVKYTGNKNKVEIICRDHGSFWQTPNNHLLSVFGCPVCANKESGGWGKSNGFYNTEKPSFLYIISMKSASESFLKVGLSKNPASRHQCISKESGYTVETVSLYEGTAKELFDAEYAVHFESGIDKYRPLVNFAGISECYPVDALNQIKGVIEEKLDVHQTSAPSG